MRQLLRFLPHRAAAAGAAHAAQGAEAARTVASQHRADRRAVARRLHPDRGGDVEQYLAALAQVDRRYDLAPDGAPAAARPPGSAARRSRRSGLRRRMNRAARAARRRLPRHAPGARRYARL